MPGGSLFGKPQTNCRKGTPWGVRLRPGRGMGEAGGGSPPRPRPKGRRAGLAEARATLSAGGSFGEPRRKVRARPPPADAPEASQDVLPLLHTIHARFRAPGGAAQAQGALGILKASQTPVTFLSRTSPEPSDACIYIYIYIYIYAH